MSDEPDLFDPRPLARATDPGTSHLAGARVIEFLGTHDGIILGVLRRRPFTGFNSEQIAGCCSLTQVQVARRMKQLADAGLIIRTGETTTQRSDRAATVWKLRPPSEWEH
ncbi:MAG: hypothetical protein IH904_00160 [Proteobacteria bacterium]|nr:hypothetical protein [Pseudomonadota bacterium]